MAAAMPSPAATFPQTQCLTACAQHARLQFRFNVREVEMGTRRPLIVQMVHDPTAQEPRCRLQNEDDDEYGPPIIPETGKRLFLSTFFRPSCICRL